MFKKIAGSIVLIVVASPFFVSADMLSDLQAQLQSLLSQLAILQQQAQQQGTIPPPSLPPPVYSGENCVTLPRLLSREMTGADVSSLQQFLYRENVYPEALVTGFFGPATERALQRWQSAHGIVSSGDPSSTGWGVAGPRTRALIQSVSCSGSTNIPPYIPPSQNTLSCTAGGMTIPAGAVTPFYTVQSVPLGSRCEQYMQMRQCINGTLTGASQYQYAFCSVQTPLSCNLDGANVSQGTSRIFYSQSSVGVGESCNNVSQYRTCENGVLLGGSQYQYRTCSVDTPSSCTLGSDSIEHNTSRTLYSKDLVGFGASCASYAQTRTCINGTLSGSTDFNKTSCTAATSSSCTRGGVTIDTTVSRTFYSAQSVTFGNTCASIGLSRKCTNGILEGDNTYQFPTCTVAAASSCVQDGKIVAHNASSTFYTVDTVPYGQLCSATTVAKGRTCVNGVLSGPTTATHASCTVAGPSSSCTLTLDKQIVKPNDPVTVAWTSTNATSANLSWVSGQSISVTPASGSRVITYDSVGSKTITLSLTGSGASAQCSKDLTVQSALPPTCDLKITKVGATATNTVAVANLAYNTPITVSWSSSGATHYASSTSATTSVNLTAGASTFVPAPGTITYTFDGPGGTCQKNVTVKYLPPTCSVTATPASVMHGDSTTMSWTSSNSDYLTATSSDHLSVSGSAIFANQTLTKDYVFNVHGKGGSNTCKVTVTVPHAIAVDAPGAGVSISEGSQLAISWHRIGTSANVQGVYLELRKSDNTSLGIITSRLNYDGSYAWTIPATLNGNAVPEGEYFIRANLYHNIISCNGNACSGAVVDSRADSGVFTISNTVTLSDFNLASALAALNAAFQALISKLSQ